MSAVRIVLISLNTLGFATLAIMAIRAGNIERKGLKKLYLFGAVAYSAVAVGGIQRLLLQAVFTGQLPADSMSIILGTQSFLQAIVVAGLGLTGWYALRQVGDRVRTADELLDSFGDSLPNIDWSQVHLTPRENEVMSLISKGLLRDSDLATDLGISAETIRSHIKAIQRKTGLRTRIEIAVAVHQDARQPLSQHPSHPRW